MTTGRPGEVHLDYKAIGDILKHDHGVVGMVDDYAHAIADRVDTGDLVKRPEDGAPGDELVIVDTYTTDRHVAEVVFAHPAALPMEAKHGSLTKAAAAVGLVVTNRKRGRRP